MNKKFKILPHINQYINIDQLHTQEMLITTNCVRVCVYIYIYSPPTNFGRTVQHGLH